MNAQQPNTPTGKTPRANPWVTRTEVVAVFSLAAIFLLWVTVIAVQQHRAGRDVVVKEGPPEAAWRVDLNTAPAGELTLLEGIGPKRAERIVTWRTEHGPFQSFEEVRRAAQLSEKEMTRIRELAVLGPAQDPTAVGRSVPNTELNVRP